VINIKLHQEFGSRRHQPASSSKVVKRWGWKAIIERQPTFWWVFYWRFNSTC